MNFLIIDGNSLVNRAFYGIKLLTAKDGHFTNAIFGFMNMFLSLTEQTEPQCIAVAFDVHAPTFRHKMYTEYKAGRKGMPPELYEQLEPLKVILKAYGCHIVECEGYEADDILGTLSSNTPENDMCYIATGDRDSLQLVRKNVNVLLTSTKMGQTQTVKYDEDKLFEEYGLTPSQMIELKALQGDNSDNIPGVAGVGPKTAGDLIKKYNSIDNIYENIDSIEVTNGVREKLKKDKENAFLSRTLGTICLSAPIETEIGSYKKNKTDAELLKRELARHEMFKLIAKLKLDSPEMKAEAKAEFKKTAECISKTQLAEIIHTEKTVYLDLGENDILYINNNEKVFYIKENAVEAFKLLAENKVIKKGFSDVKRHYKIALQNGFDIENVDFDIRLASYLLNPNTSSYSVSDIAMSYCVPLPQIETDEPEDTLIALKETAVLETLSQRLNSILAENKQLELLRNVEIPLSKVLSSMEYEGMEVNRENIESYSQVLQKRITELEKEIYLSAGEEFNINSPKQLGVILFEKLGL
ncbi:MAG: DNA polymerase I, partial [Oscillospiraceae bacterium]|nr:DNA polymerase I [Oscillospiraceae bacterium]